MRTARRAAPGVRLEAVGQATQHEHEQDRRQRLDGDLGERQVGRALGDEQRRPSSSRPCRGTAPPAKRRRTIAAARASADEQGGDRHVRRDLDEVRPARPPGPRQQQRAGHERRRQQDHAEVDRQRAGLGDRGDPVGDRVDAAQHAEVGAGRRRDRPTRRPACGSRGRRPTYSATPPARATADSTSSTLMPCQIARWTSPAAVVERVRRRASRAGRRAPATTPSTTLTTVSTIAGAANATGGRPCDAARVVAGERRVGEATGEPGDEADAVGDGEDRADGDAGERERRRRCPARRTTSNAASLAMKPNSSGTPAIDGGGDTDDGGRRPARRRPREPAQVARAVLVVEDADDHERGGLEGGVGEEQHASRPPSPSAVPQPNTAIMNPSWLTVPCASSSLRSCWRSARSPPSTIVAMPDGHDERPPQVEDRRTPAPAGRSRYTPALTIVAEWRYALTGVGATIAAGSQAWNGYLGRLGEGADEHEHEGDVDGRPGRRDRRGAPTAGTCRPPGRGR